MSLFIPVPAQPALRLDHLVLDVNGTLTDRGRLLPGIADRIVVLRRHLAVRLLADTYGTLPDVAAALGGLPADQVTGGQAKADLLVGLGADVCVAVGNGTSDALMLRAAALGIAVLGAEGLSPHAVAAADIVCATVLQALDLLLDPFALASTLRV